MATIPRGRNPSPRRSAIARGRKGAVTPAEAKAVWDSMERPTLRRVALALSQAGEPVSQATVLRWKNNGWRRTTEGVEEPEPNAELAAVETGEPPERLASLAPDRDRADDGPGRRSAMRRVRQGDVTPADAKAVWESMEKPSVRRVALALTLAGKKVAKSAVDQWKKAGWRREANPVKEPKPLAELDAAVPVLTGDPLKRLASLAPGPDPAGRDQCDKKCIDDQTDEELVALGLRELVDCTVRVLGVVGTAGAPLVLAEPDKIGVLFEKAGNALLAATECLAKLSEIRGAAATDVTPARDNVVIHPLAGTLDAIRRARAIASTRDPGQDDPA